MTAEASGVSRPQKSNILIVVNAVVALQHRPMTIADLRRESDCAKETARRIVNHLLDARLIEFHEWAPRNRTGNLAAIYRWKQ